MKENISRKQLREFGLIIGIIFPLIIGFLLPYIYGHVFKSWTIFFSLPFLILGIISPRKLIYPYKFWMFIGSLAGWLNSHIILGLIFIVVVQPISLLLKITNYDPLHLKYNNKSYKIKKINHKIDLKKTF